MWLLAICCPAKFIRIAQAMGMSNADKPQDFITMLAKLQADCGEGDSNASYYIGS